MHDLLARLEDSHVLVLSKQHITTDTHSSSVLASQTSSPLHSDQDDETSVLSYPHPCALSTAPDLT